MEIASLFSFSFSFCWGGGGGVASSVPGGHLSMGKCDQFSYLLMAYKYHEFPMQSGCGYQ